MKINPRESVILAEDFNAMIEWYQKVLDFKVLQLFEDDYHYCNLKNASGILIGIADAKEMGVTPNDRKNNTVLLQFEVDDIKEFFTHLDSHNGKITFGPSFEEKGQFWYGGFQDLEGNPFWVVDKNCP